MKNIQIIDGAVNCTYSIYAIRDELFALIFPGGCDIEFIEELSERIGETRLIELSVDLWDNPVEKSQVVGIHGTLFYGLHEEKRGFYPNKRFYDNVSGFAANQRLKFGF